jgi:cysteinyl-tRNA synthetase
MEVVMALRQKAREQKDWATSDMIRDGLAKAGIQIKDGKEGTTWG